MRSPHSDRDDLPRPLLLPFSWLYGGIMKLRRLAYRRGWLPATRLDVPVVSVGNIRVGGTGKTPLVSALTQIATTAGRRPVVLSRGYKSGLGPNEAGFFLAGAFVPLTGATTAEKATAQKVVADEARLHSARHPDVPVIIGANRQAAYRAFRQQHPERPVGLVILEDGGQHLAIHRDVDIMLVDWQTTKARIRSLPSGNYREGLGALASATAIIVTRCPEGWPPPPGLSLWTEGQKPVLLAQFRLGAPYRLGPSRAEDSPGALPPVHLLTGIAEPQRLARQLRSAGYTLTATSFYGDHEELPVERLAPKGAEGEACEGAGLTGNVGWLITEKDLYRQEGRFRACPYPVWVVPLDVAVTGADVGRGPQSLAELLALAPPSP